MAQRDARAVRGYFERIDSGWDYYAARDRLMKERDEAITAHEATLATDEERAEFARELKCAQGVYHFQEDHGFYIDQGSTAIMR